MKKPSKSPCVRLCRIETASGLCVGCKRSLTEIADWALMSDETRNRLLAELPFRSFSAHRPSPHGSVTTNTGDLGRTQLLFGREVPKWHPRIKLLGTLDTLGSFLNLCRCDADPQTQHALRKIQDALIYVMGEVATHEDDLSKFHEFYHHLSESDLTTLSAMSEQLEKRGVAFSGWVENLDQRHAFADTARTFARQAEVAGWELGDQGLLRPLLPQWLNRLADFLWGLARL